MRTAVLHTPLHNLSAHHTGKLQQSKFTPKEQGAPEEYLLYEKVEEDDDNNDPAKKYKLLTRSNLLSHAADLNALYSCCIHSQTFCDRSTCKYIIQRALRI
ncbi:hypothetical protein D3H65_16715 [Paraflavitalea soli]|uniref:Uncharacterized protein n=1 Tax=Paraflavitalea soli TaxID=2315862 RepID=A0A3B7MQB5_9BACT|nr:hypothetical protein [Paraflavitalea soli]AXY75519.1 hypothetical protein D3H65_16715 [Paraflavitalea soli]